MRPHRLVLAVVPLLLLLVLVSPAGASSVEYLNYSQDYTDAVSDLHTPSDIGTHNIFADLQDYDTNYDIMQEENTAVPTDYENFVDATSSLHTPSDIGSHSSFAEMQDYDTVYDTLTEGDSDSSTQNVGDSSGSGSSYVTIAINAMQGQLVTPTDSCYVTNIYAYGRGSSATNCKAVVTTTGGVILTNGVSSSAAWSTTAGSKNHVYAAGSRPALSGGTSYFFFIVAQAAARLYYDSTTGGNSRADSSNSYTTPTNPTDFTTGTYTWRILYAVTDDTEYDLDLEVGWTAAEYSETNEYLCLRMGTMAAEAFGVEIWDSGTTAYVNLDTSFSVGWNNYSINSYLVDATVEIRFIDSTTSGDDTLPADTVTIEAVLLHCWSSAVANYELDLEVGWTSADYNEGNEYLCIYPLAGIPGWPSEDIIVKIWSGSWVTLFSDLTPDTWNNVSIATYLTDASVEVQFLGGTETSDSTQDGWKIDAVLITTYSYLYIETFSESIGVADSGQVSMTAGLSFSETIAVSDTVSIAAAFSSIFNEILQFSETVSAAGSFVLSFFEQIVFSESVTVSALFILSFLETIGLAVFGETSKFIALEIFESIGITSSVTVACSFSVLINEVVSISQFSTFVGGSILYKLTFYEVFNVYATIPTLTAYRPSIFYDLFLSPEIWGYLGPLALIIIGYFITKKEKSLGIFFIIVESLIIANYFTLLESYAGYWWHILILLLGVIQCTFRLVDR